MKIRTLLCALLLTAAHGWCLAAPVSLSLSVSGLPTGRHPVIWDRVAADLERDVGTPLRAVPAGETWFWHRTKTTYRVDIEFTHYYSGTERKVLFPGVAARYAFRTDATGHVRITAATGDSLLAVVPFDFTWQKPLKYQFPGIDPNASSVHFKAPAATALAHTALAELATDLARAVRRAVVRAQRDES